MTVALYTSDMHRKMLLSAFLKIIKNQIDYIITLRDVMIDEFAVFVIDL